MHRLLIAAIVLALVTGCQVPPATPEPPNGPSRAGIGDTCLFTTVTTDPLNLPIAYRFDWGNGSGSGWSQFMPSGLAVSMSYAWPRPGSFQVRAQAKNIIGATSEWSAGHPITIGTQAGYPDSVVATVPVGYAPFSLCLLPNGEFLYVCNRNGTVSVVRTSDNTVVGAIELGTISDHLAIHPSGGFVYVTCPEINSVKVLGYRRHP
ncbi:MAG: hypothetical protein ABIK44_04790 [candidate division WOR-3 bacterium]